MCQKSPERRKVGDTLTATVEPEDAEVTYKWTINGQNPASGETFTVPATAKYGDEIKLVVTDADGETATDTVYVGGLTILSVEPTTAANGNVGYKYIRVTFSKSLDSLDSSEIEIRHAKSNQLFSIESLKLSADGTFADVILYGSNDADGTTFLKANQPYVCTLTKDGEKASLGFEIPGFVSDAYVKAVDVEKHTIKIGNSGRTNQNDAEDTFSSYNLPSSFDGNLGTLLGNTVSFYYDADLNISDIQVQDQKVVIGAFKYNIPSDAQSWDECYFSQGDDKYYLKETSTASSNWTHVYRIYDGNGLGLENGTVYQYAKLVLNPDGTVAQAVILPTWTNLIFATSIDGKVVKESKSVSKDFDGFTIIKDDAFITTADLEEGDVIYYNDNDGVKYAEVYNDEVSGDLTKTYNKTAVLDGKSYTYKWTDAYAGMTTGKYVKDGKYVDLEEKVLIDYEDEEEVTFTLNRLGNVVKAEGTNSEEVSYTTEYMLTANAIGYKAAGTSYIGFKVNDGTSKSTITVDPTTLKKINGVTLACLETEVPGDAGKLNNKVYFTPNAAQDDTATLFANWDSNQDGNSKVQDDADIEHFINGETLAQIFPAGTLLKVTTDEKGTVTGVATSVSQGFINLNGTGDPADVAAADVIAPTAGGKDQVFKPGLTTIVTAGGKKLSISDDAEVWIANDDFSKIKKQTYAEYTGTSLKAQNANVLIVPSGTTVKQVVILDSKNTLGDSEVAEKEWGVVTESLTGRVDDDNTNVLKKLTVLNPAGEKVVYENIKAGFAGQAKGSIVYVELDSSGQVIRINNAADMAADGVAIVALDDAATLNKAETKVSNGDDGFDKNSMLKDRTNNNWVVEASDGAVVAKFDGSKVTTTTISAINNESSMKDYKTFVYNTVRKNGHDIEASVIVAIKDANAGGPTWTETSFTSDAGDVIFNDDGDAFIASTKSTKLTATIKGLPTGVSVKELQWYYMENEDATAEAVTSATAGNGTTKALDITDIQNRTTTTPTVPEAGEIYYLVVTGSDGEEYTSTTVTLAAPEVAGLDITEPLSAVYGTPLATTAGTVLIVDQFGEALAGAYSYRVGTGGATINTNTVAAAPTPGVTYTQAQAKLEISTAATTAAGSYAIEVYNEAPTASPAAAKLLGTIELTVAPRALVLADIGTALTTAAATNYDIVSGTSALMFTTAAAAGTSTLAFDVEPATGITTNLAIAPANGVITITTPTTGTDDDLIATITVTASGNIEGSATIEVLVDGDTSGTINGFDFGTITLVPTN